jgi:hypothetical protein
VWIGHVEDEVVKVDYCQLAGQVNQFLGRAIILAST